MTRELRALVGLAFLVASVNCSKAKVATFDEKNGAIQGTLARVSRGETVVLCEIDTTAGNRCHLRPRLSDRTDRRGGFAISLVPPGSYVVCHGPVPAAGLKDGEEVSFSLSLSGKLSATMKDGKWVTSEDIVSEKLIVKKGAEVSMNADFRPGLLNASVMLLPSKLSIELREGHRFEDAESVAGRKTEVSLLAWGQ